MRKNLVFPALLLACCVLVAKPVRAQTNVAAAGQSTDANAAKARKLLDEMVQALGGQRWLAVQNRYVTGRIAGFFQGKPTESIIPFWAWTTPTEERIDLTEKKKDKQNWVQIITSDQCWEITYRGKRAMEKKVCDADLRSRRHSIEAAVKVWMKDPQTLLLYDGQALVERHLADEVSLLNAQNDSIVIRLDADSHLPLSRTWTWRDPVYHDKNTEEDQYDDYHDIDGLPTPFTVTHLHNGEMTSQRFITNAAYNMTLPPEWFDLEAIVAKARR